MQNDPVRQDRRLRGVWPRGPLLRAMWPRDLWLRGVYGRDKWPPGVGRRYGVTGGKPPRTSA